MRQAVEAQVLNPHCELGEQGLRQILSDVIEEVRQSVSQDIDGAEILHSLLNSTWLQSLLKVYECLQKYLRESPSPALDYASGLSLELLIDIRSLPSCSEEAKELYRLLRQPHLQALFSAHDTVALKDFEPVLPPMPEDLPDDEEATRIICLVKNKQPLLHNHNRVGMPLPNASPPPAKSSRGGIRHHLNTLRRLTQQKLHRGSAFGVQSPTTQSWRLNAKDSSWCSTQRGNYLPTEPMYRPAVARPHPPTQYKPISSCQVCCSKPVSQCRVCYSNLLWEQSSNHSTPSVCSSVLIDVDEFNSGDEYEVDQPTCAPSPLSQHWTVTPPCLSVPYCSSVHNHLQPGLHQRLQSQSPRIRTAPPSPMRPHHVLEVPPVELAKQESLDELRTTVQLAASSMESSTKDIKLLGERMASATERMSETVQDNSQALVLLTQVVDRLQMLLTTTRTEVNTLKPAELDGTLKKSPTQKPQGYHPSLIHQSICSHSSSSSSLSSSFDVPSTSQACSCQSPSCRGFQTKTSRVAQMKHFHTDLDISKYPLTNGVLRETSSPVKGGRSNQQKKKKKKRKKPT